MAYYCEKQSQMGFTAELKGILTLDTLKPRVPSQ